MGYHQAGFDEIVGVDIVPQPNYPFTFIQADALRPSVRLEDFDLIHASPPCQAFSVNTPDKDSHPDLIPSTRTLLIKSNRPFVIENVPPAPIRKDLLLCGSMFGMEVQRHRHFEIGRFDIWNPPSCNHTWKSGRPHTVTGHADGDGLHRSKYLGFKDTAHAKALMEMPWVETTREVTEAIPPAYTRYIGQQFLQQKAATQ